MPGLVLARNFGREAVASTGDVCDVFWFPIAQHPAQHRHLEPQIALVNGKAGPCRFEQRAMAYDLPRMLKQMHEDIESSAADMNGLAVSFQLSLRLYCAVRSKRNYQVPCDIVHFGEFSSGFRNGARAY
ncbi:MAG TPA: hypothetical protein VHY79_08460 [Rhizomicrobium sp.]|jgi:hypothetical protein|nr:hypothetical protein [Rhizomicrobium sp.]